jgi:predicted nucleic acid-binding protein
MPSAVIVNTSPLFYLHRIDCLSVLQKLYDEIFVPGAVVAELAEGERAGENVPIVANYPWITVRNVKVPAFIAMIPDLGRGEAEVLALGSEEVAPLLVIDDALARRIANLQALKFTATAGVLLKAKSEGHIEEVKTMLAKLKTAGFYLHETVVAEILKLAKEST